MKLRFKSAVAGAAALAMVGTGLALATPAQAYSGTPPWVGSADDVSHVKGAITFYDAAGNVLTGGADISNIAAYTGVTTAGRINATKAALTLAAPSSTNSLPSTWANTSEQGSTTFNPAPVGTPASVTGSGNPFLKLTAAGADVLTTSSGLVLDSSSAAYANVVELRIQDSGVGVAADPVGMYWRSIIEFNPAALGGATYDGLAPQAWRVVYPAVAGTATTTTVTATPVSGANNETLVKFTAGTTANGGGVVTFKVDGVVFGATKPVVSAGAATSVDSDSLAIAPGNHVITAEFAAAAPPLNQAGYASSTGTIASYVVSLLTHPTTNGLSVDAASVSQGSAATGKAVITDTDAPANVTTGTVSFFLDGSPTAAQANVAYNAGASGFPFSLGTSGLSVGSHSVVAVFTPATSNARQLGASTSSASTFAVTLAAYTADVQYIETVINPGTITISTPYNGDNGTCAVGTDPADTRTLGKLYNVSSGALLANSSTCGFLFLPAMTLNGTASAYSTSGTFDGISVTDTRPGDNAFTLSAISSNLNKKGIAPALLTADEIINSANIGLTALAMTGHNQLAPYDTFQGGQVPGSPFAGVNFTGYDNAAAASVGSGSSSTAGLGGANPHQVLHAVRGLGTITTAGTLTINAPTNTRDGIYAGTVTFTVIGS